MISLLKLYRLDEALDPKNIPVGTEIEILDRSPGAPAGGAWLSVRILRKLEDDPKLKKMNVKHRPGYVYRAPWLSWGESFVYLDDYGKTWRLPEIN